MRRTSITIVGKREEVKIKPIATNPPIPPNFCRSFFLRDLPYYVSNTPRSHAFIRCGPANTCTGISMLSRTAPQR